MKKTFDLRADEVKVFWLSLSLPPEGLALAYQVLSNAEKTRTQRFWQAHDQRRRIACWGQVRWLLGLALNLPPQALKFVRGRWGKPYLEGNQELEFNFSHAEDRMVLAVSLGREVGVDLEMIRPLADLERLARRCLAPSEWKRWQELAVEERLVAFLRFWTRKEALAKASGLGLSLGVRRLVFGLSGGPVAVPEALAPAESWTIREWGEKDYCAALCVRPGGFRIAECALTPDWMLKARQLEALALLQESG
jgi:4'-phosphopantetheinyl transferase